jgi:uncharacterized membrane protein YfcA
MDGASLYWAWAGNLLLGIVVGAFGTLIGAGGGFILVPLLLLLHPDRSPDMVAAMSLAIVFFNALSGTTAYARMKRIDYRAGIVFALATVPGAILGALATGFLARRTFNAIMGVVLLAVAAALFCWPTPPGRKGGQGAAGAPLDGGTFLRAKPYSLKLGVAISLVVGFVSSLLGVGGGIIHVPAMAYVLGFPVHVATATSHFILMVTALTGTLVHVFEGHFAHVGELVPLAVGVIAGAQVGAWVSQKVHGHWIVRGLAIALAAVGIRLLTMGV